MAYYYWDWPQLTPQTPNKIQKIRREEQNHDNSEIKGNKQVNYCV